MSLYFKPEKDKIFVESFKAKIETIQGEQEVWIRCLGTIWNTRFYSDCRVSDLSPGKTVTVVGRRGNKLLIVVETAD